MRSENLQGNISAKYTQDNSLLGGNLKLIVLFLTANAYTLLASLLWYSIIVGCKKHHGMAIGVFVFFILLIC